jgi:pyruvate dehydrogenase E2 component (dihydrolipoamide acetyltransferase)/2-oxoglutarate dehydrogenase E2 component (dihydrolipoamide succinyltransferase)
VAHEVIAPKSGIYDGDVRIVAWLAAEGDEVAAGQPLFEMETEKLTAEVESEDAGFLHILLGAGAEVPIGSVVGLIGSTKEEYEALAAEPG